MGPDLFRLVSILGYASTLGGGGGGESESAILQFIVES